MALQKKVAIKDYNEDKQKLLIDILLSSEDIYSRCQNILNSNYFVNKLRPAMRMITEYTEKYNVLPKVEQVNAETGLSFQIIPDMLPQHSAGFLEEIEEFCKNRAIANAVLKSQPLIEQGNYAEVERMIKDAVMISLQSDLGTDYFEDPRERLLKIKAGNGQISTGWPSLDKKLFGGWNRGELDIFVAGSGVGKSLFLQNLALNHVRQGLNVVYISLELSESLTGMRMDSMISEIGTRDIFTNLDTVEIKVKQVGFKSGSLHIKQMPQGSRTTDLRTYLKNYAIQRSYMPDVLIVDYLDLMYPNDKRISPSDLFIKDKYISEELRGLAVENNFVILTASQLNRCLTLDTKVVEKEGNIKNISELVIGDILQSNNDNVMVTDIFPKMTQSVYKIKTKSGKEIKCSANHIFPTTNGLRNIENGLGVGEKLFTRVLEK